MTAEGAQPTIAMLHGWAGHPVQYASAARAIERATGLPVTTPLLPVVTEPRTRWRPAPKRLSTIEGCAETLAEGLPSGPLILVGHSLGGGVAIATAVRRRADVTGLVLISPVGGEPRFTLHSWAEMLQGTRDEAVTNAGWDPDVRKTAWRTFARHPIAGTRIAVKGKHSDLRRPLRDLTRSGLPVTIVVPDEDRIVNTGLLVRVPGVDVVSVHGNHGWPINEPESVAALIQGIVHPSGCAPRSV